MASIIYDHFGGIIPKIDPNQLPGAASVQAHNVELSSGKLRLMNAKSGFKTNHDQATGIIKPQIPESELISIPEPVAPTLAERIRMNYPENWTWNIVGKVFIEWIDANGAIQTDDVGFNSFVYQGVEYTNDGFLLKYYLGDADRTLTKGFYYKVYGPKFGFEITAEANYAGGPLASVSYPDPFVVNATAPDYPLVNTPLYAPIDYSGWNGDPTQAYAGTQYAYGNLRLIDISGPKAISEADLTNATSNQLVKFTESGVATFYFQCNYVRNTQRFVQYATRAVDTTYSVAGDVGRPGPISDESDVIVVQPGEILKLTTPLPAGYTQQIIYRSSGDGTYRELQDEVEAGVYIDDFNNSLGEELGMYGNFPHVDVDAARLRSLFLGGRMGVLIYGEELWPSEPDQLWIYPSEYAFPMFAPIICGVGFVSSILVFTDTNEDDEPGKVYRVGGQHPKYWSRQLLSECKPLLNEKSVCTIDQTAFYVSEDGLIAVGPDGSVQNISEDFFNREDWKKYNPEFYTSYIRDSSIFLVNEGPNPTNFRFDLNDSHARLTTFSSLSPKELEWTGRVEKSYRPVAFRAIRVNADDYPVAITLTGDEDDEFSEEFEIKNSDAVLIPRMRRCQLWQVSAKSKYSIDRIAVATNTQELNR